MAPKFKLRASTGFIALSALFAASDAFAQRPASDLQASDEGGQLEEVVVTAQRRDENLQDVPIAVTSVSAATLQEAAVTSSQQLPSLVPGLNLAQNGNTVAPFIRGIGANSNDPGNELPVAVYIDNVYIASANQNLLDLSDVSNISVLKGPQGTLFGRNAVGGVIQITTKDPGRELEGRVSAGFDNYETLRGDVFVGGELAENVRASVAAVYSTQGKGWGKNVNTGNDIRKVNSNFAIRSKLILAPSEATTIRLAGDYTKRRDSLGAQFSPFPGTELVVPGYVRPSNKWSTNNSNDTKHYFRGGGASVAIDQDLGFAHFVSTSAYRKDRLTFGFDADAAPPPGTFLRAPLLARQYSQEFQLNSTRSEGLIWTVGAFYFDNKAGVDHLSVHIFPEYNALFGVPGLDILVTNDDRQRTKALAGYGQATAEIVQNTNLTLGFRYTTEKRRFLGSQSVQINGVTAVVIPAAGKLKFSKPTWRISLDHEFSPDVLGYISYNRGFKSGGFNSIDPLNPPYAPESMDAYEIGLKSEFLDRRVRINAALFYYERKGIQVNRYLGTNQVTYNGASAEVKGVDVDFQFRATEHLRIGGGFVWLDDKFTSFPNAVFYDQDPVTHLLIPHEGSAKGNHLPFASRFTGNISATYSMDLNPGKLEVRVADAYNSGWYSEPDNFLEQKPFHYVSASATWRSPDGNFSASLWGRNLLKEAVWGQAIAGASWGYIVDYSGQPRTYGVTVTAGF